jgi:pyruvate dehydrogenase E2 component (dihydrolipoamide acetyltransferase)
MASEFKLPSLGENVDSGDVVRVLVKVGDTVQANQSVIEMETGKATVEIPTSIGGTIKTIHVKEGTKAKVGQVILTLEGGASAPAAAPAAKPAAPAPAAPVAPAPAPAAAAPAPVAAVEPPPLPVSRPAPTPAPVAPVVVATGSAPASPSTRQFAREIGVDIGQVPGTGPGGRISVDDVKSFSRSQGGGSARGPARPVQPPLPDFARYGEVERQPLNNIRIATAEQMSLCWNTIPHVTLHDKADITELEKLRNESKRKAESAGTKLTMTAFLVKIAASALKVHPKFNASLDLAKGEIVMKKFFNIGVAVDTERGLVVPVLRDVERRNVIQTAVELQRLADRAKARKLSPDDMTGGCFTITNLGSIGTSFFTPIVNLPEVAILGVGRAVQEPVLVDGFFQPAADAAPVAVLRPSHH